MATTNLNLKDLRNEDTASLKPRDRILKTANRLFNEYGVYTVDIDRIISESEVSKRTFYKYFPSKGELISSYLESKDWLRFADLENHLLKGDQDPKQEILTVFDFLGDWFSEPDFNGCAFARGLSDFNNEETKPLRDQVLGHFKSWSEFVRIRLDKIVDPERAKVLLPSLLSLITGSVIVAQGTGDPNIAKYNKKAAELLLSQ